VLSDGTHTIESEPHRSWLRVHRIRLAFWIAAAEAILIAVSHDLTRWTVILLAIVAIAIYVFAGRESPSETFRDASWVFAVSQLLAFLAAIFAFLFLWIAVGAVVIFVLAALFFIFVDRR
jgi:hypothetical protein